MKNSKRPHFFNVFHPDSSSDKLKIPSGFIKHMEGRTCGSVLLVGPSDNTWHAELIQQNDDLFLCDGWPAFVRDHFIECGDSLVFRYDGNLHFTVQVFDQSSCERESTFHAKCSQDPGGFDEQLGKKRERDNQTASKDKIFEGVPKKMRGSSCQMHSECMTKNLEDKVGKSVKEGFQYEELITTETCREAIFSKEIKKCRSPSKDSVSPMLSQSKACNEKPEAAIQSRTRKEDEVGSHARVFTSLLLTPEEKKVSQSFTSSFPNFVRIMKKFNISGSYTLKIPYKFSMEHLPKCKIKIILRNLKGDCWTVNSVPTTKVHTLHTFCGGWMAFVRGNDLKMGDICIFELVRKCEMRVHILGAGKEGADGQNGKAVSNGLIVGCGAASHKAMEGLPKKLKGNSPKVHSKHVTKVGKKGSKIHQDAVPSNEAKKHSCASKSSISSASKACSDKLEAAIQNTTSTEDEPRSQARGCASTISAEEERATRSFTSSYPYFARFMKKFNISGSYTLKIPYQFSMAHLPKCKTEIVLRNLKGECWTVNSVPDTKGNMVHTFCGGWMAFVRGNDVKMGDICVFELVGESEMLVHISGIGKKGLDHQSGNAGSK